MEIAWALPCRFAEATPDGTATLVGAGSDSMWVSEVPSDVGTFLMMRISGPTYEFEQGHTLAIRLVDPERDEQELLSIDFGPFPEPPPLLHPGMDPGLLVPAAVGWHAEHFGLYTFEILVDDRRQRSIPMLVRNQADLEQQQ